MEIEDPSVSIIAFTGTSGTVIDSVTLSDFSSPLIADSGSILFGSTGRYFLSNAGGLEGVADLDGNPLLNLNAVNPGLPVTMTLDQQTGAAFVGNGTGGRYYEGSVEAGLFDEEVSIGSQITTREIRAQDGQILVVDENDILFRGSNAGDILDVLLVATPSMDSTSAAPNDPKFGGTETVVASFNFNASSNTLEQAYSVRPLEGSSGLSRGPEFNVSADQVFAGVTIPQGQFNTSSSLDQISSNGDVVAFTLPVAETAGGNFGVALATQRISRDEAGNVTGVTDGAFVIFDIFSNIIDGVPLSTTTTTLGERVFLSRGTQFEAEINPTVAANGDVIFFGRASVPGGDDIVSGYWRLRASDGVVEPFLTDGQQIEGITSFGTEDFGIIDFDSDVSFSTRLAIEPRLTINREGNVAAIVRVLLPDEVDPVTAIVGQNVAGDFYLVAHEGQEVDLGDGAGIRTVAIADNPSTVENVVFVTGGVNGNEVITSNDLDGVSDGFNVNSELAFVLSFTDGSQALLRADLGAPGAPEISVFRWSGSCGTVEWGTSCSLGGDTASNWENFDNPGQIAEQAPGLSTDPAQVFIVGADVNITQNDVSITSLSATDGTLTVERMLTIAQNGAVDQLVVDGGTVTSGSTPLTANKITVAGGTLAGAGGFEVSGDANTTEPLLIFNAGENGAASILDTFVAVTSADVQVAEGAIVNINDLTGLSLTGSDSAPSDLNIGNGAQIRGSGAITLNRASELSTDFSNGASGIASVSAPIIINGGQVFAGSGTLNLSSAIDVQDTFASDGEFRALSDARMVITGPISIAEGYAGTVDFQGTPTSTLDGAQFVFEGTTITSASNNALVFRDRDPLATSISVRPSSIDAAFDGLVTAHVLNSTINTGDDLFFRANAHFTNAVVNAGVFVDDNKTLLLEGTNTIDASMTASMEAMDLSGAILAQRGGQTTFRGTRSLQLGAAIPATEILVRNGDLLFQTASINFGGVSETFDDPDILIKPEGTGKVTFGGLAGDARTNIFLGAGVQIFTGEEGQNTAGNVLFDSADFRPLAGSALGTQTTRIVNSLSPSGGVDSALRLNDITVATSLTVENNGRLELGLTTGGGSFSVVNTGAVTIGGNLTGLNTFANSASGQVGIDLTVTMISGGTIENNGSILVGQGANLTIDALLIEADTPSFTIERDAVLTAPNQEYTLLFGGGDGGITPSTVFGSWDLEADSRVILGSNVSIVEIGKDANVFIADGALLNDLNDTGGNVRSILGSLRLDKDFNRVGDFTVGAVGAPNARFEARNITIEGDLTQNSGTIARANSLGGFLSVEGTLVAAGEIDFSTVEAAQLDVRDGGRIEASNRVVTSGGMNIDGEVIVERVASTFTAVQAQNLSIGSSGRLETQAGVNVSEALSNRGVLSAGDIRARELTTSAGSTTQITNSADVTLVGDASLAGTFNFSSVTALNVRLRDGAAASDLEFAEASQDVLIEGNVATSQALSLRGQTIDIGSSALISLISGPSGGPDARRVDVRSGVTLTGGQGLLGESATIIANMVDVTSGAAFQGNFDIRGNIINRGSFFPGFSPGVISIDGDYTQTATGLLELEIGGNTPDLYDVFSVSGTATFDPSSAINITLIDPDLDDGVDEVFRPRTGDTFDILLADSVEVTGGGEIADIVTVTNGAQSGSFLPSLMTIDGQLVLQLEAMFGSRLAETTGLNALQAGIAGALDAISEVGENDALTDFAVALDGLSDDQTGAALSQAGFSFASGLYDMGFAAINASTGHIHRHIDARIWTPEGARTQTAHAAPAPARLASPNNAGFAGGMVFEEASQAAQMVASIAANQSFAMRGADRSRFGLIASGGYSFGSVDASLNQTGIDYSGGGGALGAEAALNETVVVGVSASLTSLDGDTDNGLGDLEATHYGIAVHAVAQAGPLVVDGQVGFGWLDVESDRRIAAGDVSAMAEGESDGSTFNARARISLPITGGDDGSTFVFGPSIELNTANVDLNGFAETGAGDAGLTLSGNSQWRSNVAFGVNAAASFELGKVVLTPRASAAYEVALNRSSDPIATAFNGAPQNGFLTPTDRTSKDRFKILTATDLRLSRRISASIAYQGSYSSDIKDHTVMAQARLSF